MLWIISFTGLGIVHLGAILLMEPVFLKLPGILPGIVAIFIFRILGQLLLKPTFLKNKYEFIDHIK